jgi:hypothetical protein
VRLSFLSLSSRHADLRVGSDAAQNRGCSETTSSNILLVNILTHLFHSFPSFLFG